MTQEEVLQLNLSEEQKERVIASFTASERLKKENVFLNLQTEDEVIKHIAILQDNFEKRNQAKIKKNAEKEEERKKENELKDLVKQAQSLGFSIDDIINKLKSIIKEKHNQEIQNKINELKKQMI